MQYNSHGVPVKQQDWINTHLATPCPAVFYYILKTLLRENVNAANKWMKNKRPGPLG